MTLGFQSSSILMWLLLLSDGTMLMLDVLPIIEDFKLSQWFNAANINTVHHPEAGAILVLFI
jgi:hypothetical protein